MICSANDVIFFFSVKNKDTRLKSLVLSAVFIVNVEHIFGNSKRTNICIQAITIQLFLQGFLFTFRSTKSRKPYPSDSCWNKLNDVGRMSDRQGSIMDAIERLRVKFTSFLHAFWGE